MTCKICDGGFSLFLFFDPDTMEPLPVCKMLCARRFLEWKRGKQSKRRILSKLRKMSKPPVEISIESCQEYNRLNPATCPGPGAVGG